MTVALAAVGLMLGAALVVQSRRQHAAPPSPTATTARTYAQLAAANYKVLSPARSWSLLAFATAFRACAVRRGIALGEPRPSHTRITMRLAGSVDRQRLVRVVDVCGDALGGPPLDSSLQYRPSAHAMLLYLPKWCLLDPSGSAEPRPEHTRR